MTPERFDHILIGTGQATGVLLGGLPDDETIAVIEGGRVGGSCVNYGCTPTKTLVASAKVAHAVARSEDYGVMTEGAHVDFTKVMARMNEVRNASHDGLKNWLESSDHVTLIRGWGAFEGPKTVRVGDRVLTADKIYINVGARARVPEFEGLDEIDWLDNKRILELTDLPEHLIVIGGSYIGLEFSQMFRRFGSEVTVIEKSGQIMFREDEDVATTAQSIFEDEGIGFHLHADVERVRKTPGGLEVELVGGVTVPGSHLLIGAGRVPNSDRLNLEAAGIDTDDRGYIQVDDHTQTSVEGVYALGDVNGEGAFTHTSVNDAEVLVDHLKSGERKISDRIMTYAMYTDPPLARVGMSQQDAVDAGHKTLVATRKMSRISRAKEMGKTEGLVKLVVDGDTDLILGATILGVSGDEVINMFTAFMYSGKPCSQYRKAMFIHPTISELMPFILDDLEAVN